jgi:hypothetical protein
MDNHDEPFWQDGPVPHHHDAAWAELTAAEHAAMGSGRIKGNMMLLLRSFPDGMTDWELTEALERVLGHPVAKTGVGAMRNQLMREGWVLPTGRHRRGPYRAWNEVWVAIPKGHVPVPLPPGVKRPATAALVP